MSDSKHAQLLDQAHLSREDAERARRLARQQTDVGIRNTLSRLADESEAAAMALEGRAFDLKPDVRTRATPQRMQQARPAPYRTTLTTRLEALEHRIGLAATTIASHVAMMESERADAVNTGTSDATLAILRVTLAAQEAERARLLAELAALRGPTGSGDA